LPCDIIVSAVKMRGENSIVQAAGGKALRLSDRPVLWVTALALVAFAVRVLRLDFQALWWDEGWTVYFATADIPAMVARTAVDIHPPFYYLILHLWTSITGVSAFSVRLFSVMVGTLAIPLVFVVGRRLFGRQSGVLAALVMTLAPFDVYYSQEARMYALVALLVLGSVYVFLSLLRRYRSGGRSWHLWVLYVSVMSLAIYTQYYAAFVPLAFSIFILFRFPRYGGILYKWIAAHLVLLLVYLPWVLYAGPRLVAYVGNKLVKEGDRPVGLWTYFQSHLVAFAVGHPSEARWFLTWMAVVPVGLAVLAVVALPLARRSRSMPDHESTEALIFTVTYMMVPLLLGYLVNLRYPFTSPNIQRLFLLSAPAFFLLVGKGLSLIRGRWGVPWPLPLTLVAVVSALPLLDFYTFERYPADDYRPLVEKVSALARPEDVVVAVHPWQLGYFQAYYRGQMPSLYLTPKEPGDVTSELWATDADLMVAELDRLLAEHRFLWLPAHEALGRIVESEVESYLFASDYPILSEWYSDNTRLSCFTAARGPQSGQPGADFGGKVSLASYSVSPSPLEAGWGAVLVDLGWRIEGQLSGRYQMTLRLADERRRVWAAEDREPLGGLLPFHEQPVGGEISDRQAVLVPAGTPPGIYVLEVGLYQLETGEWLDVRDGEGISRGVTQRLGVVEVRVPVSPPPDESLFIQYPRKGDFAGGLRFLGFSLGSGGFRPGDSINLTLFWKATQAVQKDYSFSLRMVDGSGQVWASVEGPPASETYPTSKWAAGQLARGLHELMVPAGAPAGRYRLDIGLHGASDGGAVPLRRWLVDWGDRLVLGIVTIEGRAHGTNPPPSIAHPLNLRLGDGIELLGYDLDRLEVVPGGTLHLTLYWHALKELDRSYSVFNHLIAGGQRIWGQKDGVPGAGALPTSSWIAGEYIVDEYDVPVWEDTPAGQYLIETGMYDPQTLIRLPIFDEGGTQAGDRVPLEATPIQVR
jgi:4-amino-4-deoxy-L-arabinose transferase-like glycosyltransferase